MIQSANLLSADKQRIKNLTFPSGGLESVRIGKCQNRKVSELESVRIGKCQNWKVSGSESVRIGKCQNWKVSEFSDSLNMGQMMLG